MAAGPVQGVCAQTELGVSGEEPDIVGEGLNGSAEDAFGGIVVVIVILGHVTAGDSEQEGWLRAHRF